MEKIAAKIVHYIIAENPDKEKESNILNYGIQVGLEILLFVFFNLAFALALDKVTEFFFTLLIFANLRSYAGGIHCKKYTTCFLCSGLIIWFPILCNKIVAYPFRMSLLVTILCLITILLIGPVETESRQLSDKEKRHFKKKLALILAEIFIGLLILSIYNLKKYINIAILSMYLIIISSILGKIKILYLNICN